MSDFNSDRNSGAKSVVLRMAFRSLLTVLFMATGIWGCSDQKNKFTGIWKSNCEDYWGVQIQPVDAGLYSVGFCGLSGCLGPGEWTPNTRIENDPLYQIVSAKKLRIKRNGGGYFTYIRCDADPLWRGAD